MNKKTDYFYMRMSSSQKEEIRLLAKNRDMSMTQYIWYLITKDKESTSKWDKKLNTN